MARFTSSKAVVTLSILALSVVLATAACACVGVRPLAMGGAFIGLADNADATYWNPAGLTQLEQASGTFMHTITNRDAINYQDFASYSTPMKNGKSVWGASWISYKLGLGTEVDNQNWIWASVATKINDKTSVGVNVKSISDSVDGVDTGVGIDLSIFSRINDKWSVGLLVQNANEPKTTISGLGSMTWVRNWRPGVAFRPDAGSVWTADLYDATDNGAQSLRFGYEKMLKNGISLRAGYYGLGMEGAQSFTFGIGQTKMQGSKGHYTNMDSGIAVMVGDVDAVLGSVSLEF